MGGETDGEKTNYSLVEGGYAKVHKHFYLRSLRFESHSKGGKEETVIANYQDAEGKQAAPFQREERSVSLRTWGQTREKLCPQVVTGP